MAAEDLKHLFPEEDENESKKDELDNVEDLFFNAGGGEKSKSMEFKNLPAGSKSNPKNSADPQVLANIMAKLNQLDSVNDKFNDYKVNALVEAKLMDKNATGLLQRIMKKSPDSKAEVLAIKKMLTDFIKSIS